MSTLQYGTETIRMGRVLSFGVSAEMSEDGIDYICTRYDVEFQGVISLDLPGGGSTTAIAKALSASMTQPRKPIRLYVGGESQPLLDIAAPDIYGGPVCNHIQFSEFAGTRTAICTASYTARVHDCSDIPRVLTNRWSMTHELDQQYYTKRILQGEMRINPYWKLNADQEREYAFRGVPKGSQMISGSFRQSPDGLRLAYTIIYQEKYQLPPGVATDIQVEYNENSEGGGITYAEMLVDVAGPKTASKAQLLQIANEIIISRFNFRAPPPAAAAANLERDTLVGGSIREVMHENRVSVMCRVLKGQTTAIAAGGMRLDNRIFGRAIPNAPQGKAAGIPIYGNEGIRAVAAPWKMNVCGAIPPALFENAWDLRKFAEDFANTPIEYAVGELPAPSDTNISPGQIKAPYRVADIRTKHKKKTGIVPVPQAQKIPKEQAGGGGGSSNEPRDRTGAMIRLRQPMTYRWIRYNLERVGEKPDLPKVTVRAGLTLIKHNFECHAPRLAADGFTPIYTARGSILVAAHGDIDIESEDIEVGIDPTTKFSWNEGVINPPQFVPGMVEKPEE